ncbi:hypothetical protein J6590_058495 [Homalodisca vitripennis]|nr:hypothetical protein J6590_058495 [Homalodisca vitripennis]
MSQSLNKLRLLCRAQKISLSPINLWNVKVTQKNHAKKGELQDVVKAVIKWLNQQYCDINLPIESPVCKINLNSCLSRFQKVCDESVDMDDTVYEARMDKPKTKMGSVILHTGPEKKQDSDNISPLIKECSMMLHPVAVPIPSIISVDVLPRTIGIGNTKLHPRYRGRVKSENHVPLKHQGTTLGFNLNMILVTFF